MSDIEADNNNNVSLQREHPEEETESIPNEAEADNSTVPELDLEVPHGSLSRCNPNVKLKGVKLEWLETEISDKIVEASVVLVPKHRRGIYGSRDYLRNLDAATTPLDLKMGVLSQFVSSCDGETETGNQTKS